MSLTLAGTYLPLDKCQPIKVLNPENLTFNVSYDIIPTPPGLGTLLNRCAGQVESQVELV